MKNIPVYLKTYSMLSASEILVLQVKFCSDILLQMLITFLLAERDKNIQFGLNRNADPGRSVFPSMSMRYPNTDIWIGYLFLYSTVFMLYSSYIVHTNITSGHIWTLFELETLTEILQECPEQDRSLELSPSIGKASDRSCFFSSVFYMSILKIIGK